LSARDRFVRMFGPMSLLVAFFGVFIVAGLVSHAAIWLWEHPVVAAILGGLGFLALFVWAIVAEDGFTPCGRCGGQTVPEVNRNASICLECGEVSR
jgi:hypothetical protein